MLKHHIGLVSIYYVLKEPPTHLNKFVPTCCTDNKNKIIKINTNYGIFLYAIFNIETLDYYQRKLPFILSYLEIEGNDISGQEYNLYKKIKQEGNDSVWFRDGLMDYVSYPKSWI